MNTRPGSPSPPGHGRPGAAAFRLSRRPAA